MCVIVPTRSVYLFGIRMSYQKGCAIGTPGWLNVVSAVPKPLLCNNLFGTSPTYSKNNNTRMFIETQQN